MFMRITAGRVKPGCWPQYESAYLAYVASLGPVHGLLGQWLIRSQADTDFGFAISLWQSVGDMETFERSDSLKQEIMPQLAPFLSHEFRAHHCEVRYEHVTSEVKSVMDSR